MERSALFMLLVFIYAYWCPHQMGLVSFNSNTMGVTLGAKTAFLFAIVFSPLPRFTASGDPLWYLQTFLN